LLIFEQRLRDFLISFGEEIYRQKLQNSWSLR